MKDEQKKPKKNCRKCYGRGILGKTFDEFGKETGNVRGCTCVVKHNYVPNRSDKRSKLKARNHRIKNRIRMTVEQKKELDKTRSNKKKNV